VAGLLYFLNHFQPEFEGQVFTLRTPELMTKFGFIALFEHLRIESRSGGESLDVLTVAINVPSEPGQHKVMPLDQPLRIVLGH